MYFMRKTTGYEIVPLNRDDLYGFEWAGPILWPEEG